MRYRVDDQNKKYAGIDVYFSVLVLFFELAWLILLDTSLCYCICYGTFSFRIGSFKGSEKEAVKIPEKYFSYGIWVGIGAILSQLMYSLDVFLVGKLIQDLNR